MKISILSPDPSSNCLGRAYLLAKILQRRYEVEIVGPIFGDGIWKPIVDDKSITYKFVNISGRFKPYLQIRRLAQKIDGDVIYASKPLFTSFGIGLLIRVVQKKPLILDIDDWEMGFKKESNKNLSLFHFIKDLVSSGLFLYGIGSYWNILFMEKLAPFSDGITVSNTFLKSKFGGAMVRHGRDTKAFNPKRFNSNLVKEKYAIEKTKKIIMFFGSPRPHKGIEDIIKAIRLIKNQDVVLAVVGIDDRDQYSKNLAEIAGKTLGKRFKEFGLQPFEMVPEFLAMADVVVISQRKNFSTMGQMPAKVFDAMAMAKPIIASNISDLPEILDGCGWIVEPENPEQLAEKIQYVLNNPQEAEVMGNKARQKCIEKYSWDAMVKILIEVFKKYE
jgi:glycosyltransferase involved in cell wall biosynthesis